MQITEEGQLNIGDKIKIVAKSDKNNYKSITVKSIVDNGYGEEIIINKSRNYFFSIKGLVSGTSWAKEVYKLA